MRTSIFLLATTLLATAALADHPAPSGVGGGSIDVLSPDTLEAGSAAVELRLTYNRPRQRSDATLAELAGQHIHAHDSDYHLNAALGLAYGVTDKLTVSAELPYIHIAGLRAGAHSHGDEGVVNSVEKLGSVAGIGDATLLAQYKLVDGPAKLSLIGGVKLPTGGTHERGDNGERLETEHQPGTGSFDPIAGASFGTEAGPLKFTVSGIYQFSGKGAQDTRLGDRAKAGIAVSHRFGPPEHHHEPAEHHHEQGAAEHKHVPAHGHQSWDAFAELTGEWEGRQKVGGEVEAHSGGRALWLTPGVRFNSAGGLSVTGAIGVPVAQHIRASHPDNKFRLTLSLGKSF
jgi:hypothetical protein